MPLQDTRLTLGYKYDGVGLCWLQPESQSSNYMDLYKYGNVDQSQRHQVISKPAI